MQTRHVVSQRTNKIVPFPKKLLQDNNQAFTLFALWQKLAVQYADRIALRDPNRQPIVEMTYAQVYEQVLLFAGGLQLLGVSPGETIAIIAENSPRALIADLGTLFTGNINIPLNPLARVDELNCFLRHSRVSALILQDFQTWQRLQPIIDELAIPRVILLSDETEIGYCLSFQQLLKYGKGRFAAPKLAKQLLATIMYTPDNTAQAKGVVLSHGNIMHQVLSLDKIFQPQAGDIALCILPVRDCYERIYQFFFLSKGCTLLYSHESNFAQDLQIQKANYLIANLRVWKLLHNHIFTQIQQKNIAVRTLLKVLMQISYNYIIQQRIATNKSIEHLQLNSRQRKRSQLLSKFLAPFHQLSERLFYSKIRDSVATQLQYAINCRGNLPTYLDNFYEILGIEILNSYGLTETSSFLTVSRPGCNIKGTVGSALAQTQLQIVHPETKEVLPALKVGLVQARGPQAMIGYYHNPSATVKAFSHQGWLNTGELGWLTPDGNLVLVELFQS